VTGTRKHAHSLFAFPLASFGGALILCLRKSSIRNQTSEVAMASRHFTVRLVSMLSFTMLLASLCAAQTIPVSQRMKPPAAGARAAASNAVSVSPGDWSQLAKFVPINGCCLGLENNSVAISGDTVVIGQEPLGRVNTIARPRRLG
jgi:hypothetical protein